MDLRSLKYFVAVAEEGNILKASNRLHISQPPLTRQIKQLEEELGSQLFVRTTRGVELTDAGRILLDEARNLLSLAELASERTHKAGQGKLGRIDVGIFGSAVFGIIPKILLAFRQTYPDVNLFLHTLNKQEQIAALRDRRLNVGFNRLLEPMPDIVSEAIAYESLYLAVNRHHPLSKKKEVRWSELVDEPLVVFPSQGRPNFIDFVVAVCQREGFQARLAQEVGDAVNGVALVASGFGSCVVSESSTNMRIPGVAYRPLVAASPVRVDVSCIYRKNDESPILREFLGIARGFGASSA